MLRNELVQIKTELPGPKSKEVLDKRKKVIPSAVGTDTPAVINRGEGAMVEDLDGNIFMDWVGGIGVLNVGYSHPEVVKAVKEQVEKFFHTQINVITYKPYIDLAEKMNRIVPVKGDEKQTFFVNSGSECLENAVKAARAFTKRNEIVTFTNGFHGRTYFTLAMTSKVRPYKSGLGVLPGSSHKCELPYIYRRPKGMTEEEGLNYYIEKLRMFFKDTVPAEDVAAIVIEPVVGEGGFIPIPIEYVKELRKICDENGILLVADEVQCGFCRTGRMFASEYWAEAGAAPDIITSAKSIAAGMPISAVTARKEIMDALQPGAVGGTYGGNPVAAASALKVIEIYERDNLAGRAMEINEICTARFEKWKAKYQMLGDTRGLGAMLGIEFVKDRETKEPAAEENQAIIAECLQNGLIVQEAGLRENSIRFLMPLVLTDEQLNNGLDILEKAMDHNIK
ncbi:MAG: aspartate aminotransferase family protein [Clostridia bacterium]|nr:aspartate aminotransferase family protein [Clostridia bacterium]